MKRKTPTSDARKLAIRRETLRSLAGRVLGDDELRQIAGGAVPKQSRMCTTWAI